MSFRFRLVAYFLLLSLVPATAVYLRYRTVAHRSESRLVDARLRTALAAGVAAYDEQLQVAGQEASGLAREPAFLAALARRDEAALRRLLAGRPNLRVEAGGLRVGDKPRAAAERRVEVLPRGGGRALGVLVASVPLDAGLARTLRRRTGLEGDEHVLVTRGGRVVAASGPFAGRVDVPRDGAETVELGGDDYRVLAAWTSHGARDGTALAVLSPRSRLEAANASTSWKLLLALALALLFVLVIAYLEGRAIVRRVAQLVDAARAIAGGRFGERVPVRGGDELALLARSFNEMAEQLQARLHDLDAERRRVHEATLRFGQALAATHDVDGLLRAVVETAVEATGASAGVLASRDGELVRVGDPANDGDRVELPLNAGRHSFGRLVLTGREFSAEARETAALLVGQAIVALENARLHRIVERQALVDGLTGLANRRHAEEALAIELTRASRFGTPLSLVVADLDGFKAVNDRYGHPSGDAVLRELADVLRDSVREIDLPARWGGEEFVLLLPSTDTVGAAQVADRVRRSLAERTIVSPDGEPMRITASFGVASYPPARSARELVAAADSALYEAKRAGKDRVATAGEPIRHA